MALIPGFEYDIFISYAHLDNATLTGQADGWIKQFHENLNLMLAKRFGRMGMVKIWWDSKKLDGSVLFDKSIEDGINKSAIMICLNSSSYEQSDYCKQELSQFYNKAKGDKHGLQIGDRSRIIHVLLNNIPHTQWPKELSGTSGFPFHDARDQDNYGDTHDTVSHEFKLQMRNLRDAIWSLLTSFSESQGLNDSLDALKSNEEDDAFTIYFGEVPDTLRSPRKRIIKELEKKGFKIIAGVPPPDEQKAHEEATIKALHKSQLAIHLLDQYTGREIVGDSDHWYPQKQTELALNTAVAQMIWIPAEVDYDDIEEEEYKLFLQKIEDGTYNSKKYEFIRGIKSALAQEIVLFAEQLKNEQHKKVAEQGQLSVLLDTHFSDQFYAFGLGKTLDENNIQPFINPQEDDPRKNINLLGERMSQVQKLIFIYGNVSKEWVLERMNAALQLILTNNYPIEDFFIYMAPPHKEADDININQRLLKVNVINSSDTKTFDTDVIKRFLDDLKTEVE